MVRAQFSIDVLGFTAQQASDLLVGNEALFTRLMADRVPQIASVRASQATQCSRSKPTLRSRLVHYELDPMVWEPLRLVLQTAVPGLITYTDTVTYRTDMPGWAFVSEWGGVPGIDASNIQIHGGARVTEDGPMGCRVHYDVNVECRLPLVANLVEQAIVKGFRETCMAMPRLFQHHAVMWAEARPVECVASTN